MSLKTDAFMQMHLQGAYLEVHINQSDTIGTTAPLTCRLCEKKPHLTLSGEGTSGSSSASSPLSEMFQESKLSELLLESAIAGMSEDEDRSDDDDMFKARAVMARGRRCTLPKSSPMFLPSFSGRAFLGRVQLRVFRKPISSTALSRLVQGLQGQRMLV